MNILSGTVRTIKNAGSWAILRVCQSYRQPVASVVKSPDELRCYSTTNKYVFPTISLRGLDVIICTSVTYQCLV